MTLAVLLSGCGTGRAAAPPQLTAAMLPAGLPPLTRTAPLVVTRPNPPVGAAQHVLSGGAKLTVTVTRVIDPLSGVGAALPPGARAVGVLVQISNGGPDVYDSSSTGDFSVVDASAAGTPVYVADGICRTNVEDFDNYITAGETRSGCVAFAVGRSARLLAVRFSPHARVAGQLTWRLGASG